MSPALSALCGRPPCVRHASQLRARPETISLRGRSREPLPPSPRRSTRRCIQPCKADLRNPKHGGLFLLPPSRTRTQFERGYAFSTMRASLHHSQNLFGVCPGTFGRRPHRHLTARRRCFRAQQFAPAMRRIASVLVAPTLRLGVPDRSLDSFARVPTSSPRGKPY